MMHHTNLAVVVPLANEEKKFEEFATTLKAALMQIPIVTVYLVTDLASKDKTPDLCKTLSEKDMRFKHIHATENKNVVGAYLTGIKEAVKNKHDLIIEMDGGLSHNPAQITEFVNWFEKGFECIWGSRYVSGASSTSTFQRKFLSHAGTFLSNILLGTRLKDMTSGYQGFSFEIARQLTLFPLKSTAHFYQTEVRYLLRKKKQTEIPISYQSPSPNIKTKFIFNALKVLLYYFICRIRGNAKSIG